MPTDGDEVRALLAEERGELLFTAAVEALDEGILVQDSRGRVVRANSSASTILGIEGARFRDLADPDNGWYAVRPDGLELDPTEFPGYVTSTTGEPQRGFILGIVSPDDVTTWLSINSYPIDLDDQRLVVSSFTDITEQRAMTEALEHQATHDALTGLPNRALLSAELAAALNRRARHGRGVGTLFVELGRMKVVTDSLGHGAGDQIVLEATARLVDSVGDIATVTRWGGDEFVLFAEDLDDVGDVVDIAVDVIETLDRPYLIGSEEALIKTSVGIGYAADGGATPESLTSNADVAMHRARSQSGPGYEVFDAEMREWIDTRRKLEIAMRHGIDRGEFELYYQPVITVSTGTIHGFEALVRWNHPELGLLLPGEFISLAEDSGLIVSLGEQLLRSACEQLSRWQRSFPELAPAVSVNLSAVQLALPGLEATVAAALADAGADPGGLDLEITETVLLDDVDAAATTLDTLKRLGVNLVLDDFGTGYSSLSYLCRFPIDVVKVDQSFVSRLGTESRDASMVSVVVGMAQTLAMDVVAEGIETAEQLAALNELRCIYAQGFLFSKARPAADAEQLLAESWQYRAT